MNKYIISILSALTLFTIAPAFGEQFHAIDGSPGCVDQQTITERFATLKAVQPSAIISPEDNAEEGMGKKVLAAINTVLKDQNKELINARFIETIEVPEQGVFFMYGDEEGKFCNYIKLDVDDVAKVRLILRTYEASELKYGPTL